MTPITPERLAEIEAQNCAHEGRDIVNNGSVYTYQAIRDLCAALQQSWKERDAWQEAEEHRRVTMLAQIKELARRGEEAEYERDDAIAALDRLHDAIAEYLAERGVFSSSEQHDFRCPKSRPSRVSEWKVDWVCQCGAEELSVAMCKARERTEKEGAES